MALIRCRDAAISTLARWLSLVDERRYEMLTVPR
jgi:hypothetical protein